MKNYNDFALPSNSNLQLMQEMYLSNSFHRTSSLNKISYLIKTFLSHCYGLESKINVRIRTRLEDIKKELDKLIENLTLTFSFNQSVKISNISSFNLFSAIRILIEIINELHNLENNEDKIYIKKFTQNTISSLTTHICNLFRVLEESFIPLFRYI